MLAADKACPTLQSEMYLKGDLVRWGRYPDLLKVNPTEISLYKATKTSEIAKQDAKKTLR